MDQKPNITASPALQEPSSGKAPRSWVPRACDRCRKRKARCDQQIPCRNCAEAGVTCTHDAPVLKRGPRPKPRNRDVESRLRNLESLLASISSGSSSAAVSLSRRELDQIRVAANLTPRSDTSPESDPAGSGSSKKRADVTTTPTGPSAAGMSPAVPSNMNISNTIADNYVPSIAFDPFGVPIPSQQSLPGASQALAQGYQPPLYQDPSVVGFQSVNKSPQAATTGQDLLYRDNEGQTKWLGPSSGMPLLERLKLNGTGLKDENGNSLNDEWTSLSNAIGLNVENSNAIDQVAREALGPAVAISPSSAKDEHLWVRITTVIPSDLLDSLVRYYFTISHLLWPIIHAPTFMQSYVDSEHRKNPSFVALVLSICSLASRYTPDPRLRQPGSTGQMLQLELIQLCKEVIASATAERSDLQLVQALFNLSVVQEGMARSNQVWMFLSQAVGIAFDIGLHRRRDEYGFTAVELEEQKRTLWALYCQSVAASCTYGRPSMLRLADIELGEPTPVDDVYISVEQGIGTQPSDRPSVMAGFVAGIRLHMILERTVRRVNQVVHHDPQGDSSFIELVGSAAPRSFRVQDELELLPHVTDNLVGDWSFSPSTVSDSDSVRFFQRTRVFTLQQYIRLLSSRHAFTEFLGSPRPSDGSGAQEEQAILQQTTQSALGIIGTYSIIDGQGRLDFFGAHAISQLTQAGAGLIGVLLHLRSTNLPGSDQVQQIALQGLCASIIVLRKLGPRRPAGNRSAELLIEFARACHIAIPGLSENDQVAPGSVEVPMLRALPRKTSATYIQGGPTPEALSQAQFDEWLGIALQGTGDVWMGMPMGDPSTYVPSDQPTTAVYTPDAQPSYQM